MCQTSSVLDRGVHCRVRPRVWVVRGTGTEWVWICWPCVGWRWGVSGGVLWARGGGGSGGEGVPWRSRW